MLAVQFQRRCAVSVLVAERDERERARNAVDGRVMHAMQQGVTAGRNARDAVQALHDIHIPERPRHIHRPAEMAGRDDAELAPVARLGQPRMRDMRFDVEVLILHPVGI